MVGEYGPCIQIPPDESNRSGLLQKVVFNLFPNDKFLDSSKLKEFADDNFKFNKNGIKFSSWEENIVGKGEIAH